MLSYQSFLFVSPGSQLKNGNEKNSIITAINGVVDDHTKKYKKVLPVVKSFSKVKSEDFQGDFSLQDVQDTQITSLSQSLTSLKKIVNDVINKNNFVQAVKFIENSLDECSKVTNIMYKNLVKAEDRSSIKDSLRAFDHNMPKYYKDNLSYKDFIKNGNFSLKQNILYNMPYFNEKIDNFEEKINNKLKNVKNTFYDENLHSNVINEESFLKKNMVESYQDTYEDSSFFGTFKQYALLTMNVVTSKSPVKEFLKKYKEGKKIYILTNKECNYDIKTNNTIEKSITKASFYDSEAKKYLLMGLLQSCVMSALYKGTQVYFNQMFNYINEQAVEKYHSINDDNILSEKKIVKKEIVNDMKKKLYNYRNIFYNFLFSKKINKRHAAMAGLFVFTLRSALSSFNLYHNNKLCYEKEMKIIKNELLATEQIEKYDIVLQHINNISNGLSFISSNPYVEKIFTYNIKKDFLVIEEDNKDYDIMKKKYKYAQQITLNKEIINNFNTHHGFANIIDFFFSLVSTGTLLYMMNKMTILQKKHLDKYVIKNIFTKDFIESILPFNIGMKGASKNISSIQSDILLKKTFYNPQYSFFEYFNIHSIAKKKDIRKLFKKNIFGMFIFSMLALYVYYNFDDVKESIINNTKIVVKYINKEDFLLPCGILRYSEKELILPIYNKKIYDKIELYLNDKKNDTENVTNIPTIMGISSILIDNTKDNIKDYFLKSSEEKVLKYIDYLFLPSNDSTNKALRDPIKSLSSPNFKGKDI